MTNSYDRLSPFIREYIYRNNWTELRGAQNMAISAILDSENHVLIASGTASGKTEAAFFPVLSLLYDDKPASFGVLYVSPLKALINDQFERISDILTQADMPVFAWHGDRNTGEKNRAMRTCRGVLQITPESLEALLMNNPDEAKRMLFDLRFIIIDEMHAFMGQDRGLQLLCQIGRIERLVEHSVRRIGLSATIHDYTAAQKWLGAGSNRSTAVIESSENGRRLNLAMEEFDIEYDAHDKDNSQISSEYAEYLYKQVYKKKCIIFTNSRIESERVIFALKELADMRNEPDVYYVHHGSIASSIRGETEALLKNTYGAAVVAATRTLELGIDIGGLERVVQLGAANTCSSFVQRLGRSGRRGEPANMRFITNRTVYGADLLDDIPYDLLQNIAVIQLYLEKRWVETPADKSCPYSILIHQTLSILNQTSMRPPQLAKFVLTLPGFDKVSIDDYRALLRYALEKEYIQRTDDGELIVGINAERYTNSYKFFSVFQDAAGYKVFHNDREIGEIDSLPKVNDVLLLSGRKWRVVTVDEKHERVFVDVTKASVDVNWMGKSGDVDDCIVERMKQVLLEDTEYPYLQDNALNHLREARRLARSQGMLRDFSLRSNGHIILHPWLGTRKLRTLCFLLANTLNAELGVYTAHSRKFRIDVAYKPSAVDFYERLRELVSNLDVSDVDLSALKDKDLLISRYDIMLPRALLEKAYIHDSLDLPGVISSIALSAMK